MPRVKRGRVRARKRSAFLAQAKGFKWGRKKKIKLAKPAIKKAGVYAYRDRRNKKRAARGLWLVNLNAAVRSQGLNYSKFIDKLKKQGIALDRKVLAGLARQHPAIFSKIVDQIK
ncbi:MAG: 50S ribosomal protein L20 [Candidatus Komeilibacteria bacterium]|nr:50S ribosomal protein L20 [Candidatus Komeilibacteria bacterium]